MQHAQPTCLDLRQVEHLVHQSQQVLSTTGDAGQILALPFVDGTGNADIQQLRIAEHRIDRGAQFVAHRGEERRLCTARLLSGRGHGLQLDCPQEELFLLPLQVACVRCRGVGRCVCDLLRALRCRIAGAQQCIESFASRTGHQAT